MTDYEQRTTTWRAVVSEWADTIIEWLGWQGYLMLTALAAVLSGLVVQFGSTFVILSPATYLWLLGFCFGGGLVISVIEFGKDGDGGESR